MWVLGVFIIIAASGVEGADYEIYNQQTDRYVQTANSLSSSVPNIELEDIHPNLPIINLPFIGTIYMAVDGFKGEMGDRRTLERLFDAKKYSSRCNATLVSNFHYDNLTVEYKYVLANFLYFFRFQAALKMRIEDNSFLSSITKTCDKCYVNGLQVQAFQDYDIQVKILSTKWNPFSWIMKWVMVYGFNHFNTYYIQEVINHQVKDLFNPFVSTYCSQETPLNNVN